MLAFIIAILAAAEDVPLPKYEIEEETIQEEIGDYETFDSYTQYTIHFGGSGTRIELGKEARVDDTDYKPLRGMEPGSFEIEWVRPGDVLALSWSTHSISQSHRTMQAIVLLHRADTGWEEIFRTFVRDYYRGGWMDRQETDISIAEDADVYRLRIETRLQIAYESMFPLAYRIEPNSDKVWYHASYGEGKEWPCRIDGEEFVIGQGISYLDLQEREVAPAEVAQAVAPYVAQFDRREVTGPLTPARTELARMKMKDRIRVNRDKLAELRELNPGIAHDVFWTGKIVTAIIPPYVPEPKHRWADYGK